MPTQYQEARSAQKRSQAWAKQMMRKAHQWEVEDLRAAGLNPILSAGSSPNMPGGGPAPFGGIESTIASASDAAEAGIKGRKMSPEMQLITAQRDAQVASAKEAEASADLKKQERDFKFQETDYFKMVKGERARQAFWERLQSQGNAMSAHAMAEFNRQQSLGAAWNAKTAAAKFAQAEAQLPKAIRDSEYYKSWAGYTRYWANFWKDAAGPFNFSGDSSANIPVPNPIGFKQ